MIASGLDGASSSGGGRCRRQRALRKRLVSRRNRCSHRAALDRESGKPLARIAPAVEPQATRWESKECRAVVVIEACLRVVSQLTEKVLPQPALA